MSDSEEESVDPLLRAVARAPAMSPPRKLQSGTRMGAFVILAELGAGGMGEVYRARDERLQREVALKVIHSSETDSAATRRRFLREARAAAAVSHPNVATVFEVGEHEGQIFIAMELAEGPTLRERIHDGPLDVDEVMRIARSIAAGLARAHDSGVVHRDLKPENVIVGREVKVLDFGLARIEDSPSDLASTSVHGVAGTPAYMSPEQAMGKVVDVRTDVYAFGVVLYEMFAGERPFSGASPLAVGIATARDPHQPLRARRPDVPEAASAIVDRCLAKDPDARFAHAGELLAALEAGVATSQRAPVPAPSPARSGRVVIALAVFALAGIGAWAWRASRTSPVAETAKENRTAVSDQGGTATAIATAPPSPSTPSLAPSTSSPPSLSPSPSVTAHMAPARSAQPVPSAKPSASSRHPLADQY